MSGSPAERSPPSARMGPGVAEVAALAAFALVIGAVGFGLGILLAPRVARLVPREDAEGPAEAVGGTDGGDDGPGDR